VEDVPCTEHTTNANKILAKNPEQIRPLPSHKWGDKLREIGWGCVDWIHMAQNKDQ